jgi:hypothetical protein
MAGRPSVVRLLKDHQIALPGDPELIDELVNVKLVEQSPGSYRIDHTSGAHDDRVISLGLAAYRLASTAAKPKIDTERLAAALALASSEFSTPTWR